MSQLAVLLVACNMAVQLIWLLASLAIAFSTPEDKYTTKYDNIDLDQVVRNERLLKNYVDCLMDRGSCTPDGAELKKNMPDAIETNCSKCSAKQKQGSEFIMNYIIDNKPDFWQELETKYDPEGIYKKKYLLSKNPESATES